MAMHYYSIVDGELIDRGPAKPITLDNLIFSCGIAGATFVTSNGVNSELLIQHLKTCPQCQKIEQPALAPGFRVVGHLKEE